MIDQQRLLQATLDSGATKATVIPAAQVVTSRDFRAVCAGNGCGLYDKCWTCPPAIGDIDRLIEEVRGYTHGVLYQTIRNIEDSFDLEGMLEAGKNHAQVSQRVQQALRPLLGETYLHLSCGGCRLCDSCAKREEQPCRHPEKALSSMEGYGIDVYRTSKDTSLRYINGENTVTYFGIVLFRAEE